MSVENKTKSANSRWLQGVLSLLSVAFIGVILLLIVNANQKNELAERVAMLELQLTAEKAESQKVLTQAAQTTVIWTPQNDIADRVTTLEIQLTAGKEELQMAFTQAAQDLADSIPTVPVVIIRPTKTPSAMDYYAAAIGNIQEKNYEKAAEYFSRVIELEPDNLANYYNRMETYLRGEQFDKALDDMNHIIEMSNADADHFLRRGLIYLKMENEAMALADFNTAIELDKDYESAYVERGKISLNHQDYAAAIQDFETAIGLHIGASEADFWLGRAYEETGQSSRAIDAYQNYVDLKVEGETFEKEAQERIEALKNQP